MGSRHDHHPRNALADPEAFYEWSFENKINERYARFVGWAKNKYLTGRLFSPLVRPLGTVAVHPKNRYAKYDLYPTDEEMAAVRESAFGHSADHLSIPGNSLAIFPAGSKGEDRAREGVGHVLERLGDRNIMGVHIEMLSDTAKKVGDVEAKNRPKNLKVIFTSPYETDPRLTAKDYVDIINERAETASQILAA